MTRLSGMIGALVLGTALAVAGLDAAAEEPPRPNIIFIMVDDLGFADAGFQGSDIATPARDALVETGARLTQFYAQPMCTPTRAALLTGRYPMRYGLQTGVIPGAGTDGLALDEQMLPQMLQTTGYLTAMVGKWHLGHADPAYWPMQRGFDSFYGALVGEIDPFEKTAHGVPDWYRGNAPLQEEGYDNTLFGDEAVRLIEQHDGSKPMFLYLAFTAPHTPFQAPQAYLDRFPQITDPNRRAYAAMIAVVDDAVAKVVAALDEKGMRDNTLILFHSDNGGVTSSLFTGDTKVEGALPARNTPLREGKGTLYEGGTRVPAFANWLGQVAPETVRGLIHVTDMFPTLAGLAGGDLSVSKPLDGMDQWATISTGAPSPRTELLYNVDPLAGALREGDWKLVWKAALPPKVELFDLGTDPGETLDLSAERPDLVARLQARIVDFATAMAPPLLMMEAVRLTFYIPPISGDPSVLLNQGD